LPKHGFMRPKYLLFLIMILVAFVYGSCKKDPIEDPHNHSLLNKTVDQIRSEIAGKWQIKRTHSEGCGFIGCWNWDTTYANSTGDFIYFLVNDTVKRTGYTGFPIKVYEKAEIKKEKNYSPVSNGYLRSVDSIYIFRFSVYTLYVLTMLEIKNDTLVMDDGWGVNYLTRH
jgi:hypothetical protein